MLRVRGCGAPSAVASLLACALVVLLLSSPSHGAFTPDASIYFPSGVMGPAFDPPMPYVTGLEGNGTTLNVAVMPICAAAAAARAARGSSSSSRSLQGYIKLQSV